MISRKLNSAAPIKNRTNHAHLPFTENRARLASEPREVVILRPVNILFSCLGILAYLVAQIKMVFLREWSFLLLRKVIHMKWHRGLEFDDDL